MAAGVLVLSLSASLYQTADLGIAPYDALSIIMADRLPLPYFWCRILTDSLCTVAAFLLGGKVRGTLDAPVPGREDWQHVLLITDKTGKTPAKYPRKAGTPGKKPLGM